MTDLAVIPQDAWVLAVLTFGLGLCAGVVWWAMVMDRVDPQPKPRSTLWGPLRTGKPRTPQHSVTKRFMTREAYEALMAGDQSYLDRAVRNPLMRPSL